MNPTLIQIFTDGGSFENNKLAVSVGIICINGKSVLTFKKVSKNKDSNYSEIFALKKALSRLYGIMAQSNMYDNNYIIEIYTDSLISINIIRSQLYGCNVNYTYKYLVSEIIELIEKLNKRRVLFYHIKSHMSKKMIKKNYKEFCTENLCDIPFNKFIFIYQQNKKCDKIVKYVYIKEKNSLYK